MVDFRINVIIDSRNAATGASAIEKRLASLQRRAGSLNAAFGRLGGVLAGLFAFKAIQEQLDGYTALQNRLAAVTKEGEDLGKVQKDLLQVSNRSRSSLQEVVRIYSRLSTGIKNLGISQAELTDFTETLSKTIAISGATSYEAAGALTQFSQAMASGALRGDELRSVLEQLPEVANVIGKRFGVTAPQLAILGKQGKITSDQIIQAFRDAREEIEKRFAKTVPTIAQSFTILKNQILVTFGQIDQSLGISRGFNKVIVTIAENLNFLVEQLQIASGTFVTTFDPEVANGFRVGLQAAFTVLAGVFEGFVRAVQTAVGLLAQLGSLFEGLDSDTLREIVAAFAQVVVFAGILTSSLRVVVALSKTLYGPFALAKSAVDGISTAWTFVNRQMRLANITLGKYNRTLRGTVGGVGKLAAGVGMLYVAGEAQQVMLDQTQESWIRITAGVVSTAAAAYGLITTVKGIAGVVQGMRAAWTVIAGKLPAITAAARTLGVALASNNAILIRAGGYVAAILLGFEQLFSYIIGQNMTFGETWEIILLSFQKTWDQLIAYAEVGWKKFGNFVARIGGEAFGGLAEAANAVIGAFIGAASFTLDDEEYAKLQAQTQGLEDWLRKQSQSDKRFLVYSEKDLADSEKNLQNTLEKYEKLIAEFGERVGKRATEQENADFAARRAQLLVEAAAAAEAERARLGAAGGEDITGKRGAAPPQTGPQLPLPPQGLGGGAAPEDIYAKELNALKAIVAVEATRITSGELAAQQLSARYELEQKLSEEAETQITLTQQQADELAKFVQLSRDAQAVAQLADQLDQKKQLVEQERLLNELLRVRPDLQQQINDKLYENKIASLDSTNTLGAGFQSAYMKALKSAEDFNSMAQQGFNSFVGNSADALTEFVMTGKANFKEFAASFLADIARMIAQALILKLIQASLGMAGVDTTVLFGGGKAAGGPVKSDRSYLVGEKGPEIFQPNSNGNIVPNDKIMMGGAPAAPPQVNVQVVNVEDPNKIPQTIAGGNADDAILNVLSRRRDAVKRALS